MSNPKQRRMDLDRQIEATQPGNAEKIRWKQLKPEDRVSLVPALWPRPSMCFCFFICHLRWWHECTLESCFQKWPIKMNIKHCKDIKCHMDVHNLWLRHAKRRRGMCPGQNDPEAPSGTEPAVERTRWQMHGHFCRVKYVLYIAQSIHTIY